MTKAESMEIKRAVREGILMAIRDLDIKAALDGRHVPEPPKTQNESIEFRDGFTATFDSDGLYLLRESTGLRVDPEAAHVLRDFLNEHLQ